MNRNNNYNDGAGAHVFMKTAGGVTRGHGISLSNTATWVPSKPATSRLIDAIETFGKVASTTSAQHVDKRECSQSLNHVHAATFLNRLNLHNPSPLLTSLVSSIVVSAAVDCDDALLLEKVPPVAKEQRLAVASVRNAVKLDVFINTTLVRR